MNSLQTGLLLSLVLHTGAVLLLCLSPKVSSTPPIPFVTEGGHVVEIAYFEQPATSNQHQQVREPDEQDNIRSPIHKKLSPRIGEKEQILKRVDRPPNSHVDRRTEHHISAETNHLHTHEGAPHEMAEPEYLSNASPIYPRAARLARIEGVSVLAVEVSIEGLVENLSILTTSGSPILDNAALTAVKRWRFRPAMVDGMPIESSVTVPVRFTLEK